MHDFIYLGLFIVYTVCNSVHYNYCKLMRLVSGRLTFVA